MKLSDIIVNYCERHFEKCPDNPSSLFFLYFSPFLSCCTQVRARVLFQVNNSRPWGQPVAWTLMPDRVNFALQLCPLFDYLSLFSLCDFPLSLSPRFFILLSLGQFRSKLCFLSIRVYFVFHPECAFFLSDALDFTEKFRRISVADLERDVGIETCKWPSSVSNLG